MVNKMAGFEEIKSEISTIASGKIAVQQELIMSQYRNAIRNAVVPYTRGLNKPCTLSYRELLAKLYFELESITEKMDACLKMCQEYPAEISKSDAVDVSIFISEIDVLVKDGSELFVKFSEK